jgi:hypothetical protein
MHAQACRLAEPPITQICTHERRRASKDLQRSDEEPVGDAPGVREEEGARVGRRGLPPGDQTAGGLTQRRHRHGRAGNKLFQKRVSAGSTR